MRWSALFCLVGLVSFSTPCVAQESEEPQPTYIGQPHSYWVRVGRVAEKQPSTWLHLRALRAIRALGKSDADTAALLKENLASKNPIILIAAIECAATLGNGVSAIAPDLVKILENPDTASSPLMTLPAIEALSQMGVSAKIALPVLQKMLKSSSDEGVRVGCAEALGLIGNGDETSIAALKVALTDKSNMVVVRAAESLRIGNSATDGLSQSLATAIADTNPVVKEAALIALSQLGVDARTKAPSLTSALSHTAEHVQLAAAHAFRDIAPTDDVAIQSLIASLGEKSRTDRVKLAVIAAIANIGPAAKSAAGPLATLAADTTTVQDLRVAAIMAIAQIGADKSAVDSLAKMIGDKTNSAQLRSEVIRTMGLLGPIGGASVDVLRSSLSDASGIVISSSAIALSEMGLLAKPAIPELIQALKTRDLAIYKSVSLSLGRLGADARDAVPTLAVDLNDRDLEIRQAAAAGLAAFGSEAKQAVPALMLVVRGNETTMKRNGLIVLAEIGPAGVAAIPAITAVLRDRDPESRRLAVYALGNVAPSSDPAVANLMIGLLKDATTEIRAEACIGLGRLRAESAIAALKDATNDRSRIVREAATAASALIRQPKG